MSRSLFVVQSNAVTGREDEYNEWYTNVHMMDTLAVDGWMAGQRFEVSSVQRNRSRPPYPYRYLAVYEIEGDPQSAFAGFDRAMAAGMVMSSAMAADRVSTLFIPITERVLSRQRKAE